MQKNLKQLEEDHCQKFDDIQTTFMKEIDQYKNRIQQLEIDNEQLQREDIVHVEPIITTINNEERERFEKEISQFKETNNSNCEYQEKLIEEIENHKKTNNELQVKFNLNFIFIFN